MALNDKIVAGIIKNIAAMPDQTQVNKLFDEFANAINALIEVGKRSITDEDDLVELDRLKRILGFTPKEELLIRCNNKIWAVRDHILKKNAEYFINKDYGSVIKKDRHQRFIESLIEIIRDNYGKLSLPEQEIYWKKGFTLLEIVARFRRATNPAQK